MTSNESNNTENALPTQVNSPSILNIAIRILLIAASHIMTVQNPHRFLAIFAASQWTSRTPLRSFKSAQIEQSIDGPIT